MESNDSNRTYIETQSEITDINSEGQGDFKKFGLSAFKSSMQSMQTSSAQFREWFVKSKNSVQPWTQFIQFSRFKPPKSIAPAGKRIVTNLEKFQGNYVFVFLALVVFCILTTPLLLIAILGVLGACYMIKLKNQERNINIMGRDLNVKEQYTLVGFVTLPLFYYAGAGSLIFWVVGLTVAGSLVHAAMYIIDDEEPFEVTMDELPVPSGLPVPSVLKDSLRKLVVQESKKLLIPKNEDSNKLLIPKNDDSKKLLIPKNDDSKKLLIPKNDYSKNLFLPKNDSSNKFIVPKNESLNKLLIPQKEGPNFSQTSI